MKTSNIILLVLIAVLFLIPTVFFAAFSYKLKHTDLTKFDEAINWSRIDIGPARFIQVKSPETDILNCTLAYAEKPYYEKWKYGQGGDDSVSISNVNDTLIISYIPKGEGRRFRRDITLFVSEWQHLDIANSTVSMDSSFGGSYDEKFISLSNSELNLGEDMDDEKVKSDSTSSNNGLWGNILHLTASESNVLLNKGFNVQSLVIDFNDGDLTIKKGVGIQQASGSISSDTHINLDGLNFKKLVDLVVK